jgi:hypothetical protein
MKSSSRGQPCKSQNISYTEFLLFPEDHMFAVQCGVKSPPSAPPAVPPIIIVPFSYHIPRPAIDPGITPDRPPVLPPNLPGMRAHAFASP